MDECIADAVFRETHPDVGAVISSSIDLAVDQYIQSLDVIDDAIHDEVEEIAEAGAIS